MVQINPNLDEKRWAIKVAHLEANDGTHDFANTDSNKVILESLAYSTLIPIFSILLSTGFTLVPQHDVFDQPNYWYEVVVPWTCLAAAFTILHAMRMNLIFKEFEFVKSPKIYIKLFQKIH